METGRCDAAEIADVLVAAAQPKSWLVLDQPLEGVVPEVIRITTASLWQLSLWREPGEGLTSTLQAVSPDLRQWDWGCQRHWLGDGSVIEPLELIGAQCREALDVRLFSAVAMPPRDVGMALMPDLQQIKPKARPVQRRRVKA